MTKRINTVPGIDGYRMPGEFEPHDGCLMIWPTRPGSWNYGAKDAQKAFCQIAKAISRSEQVYVLVDASHRKDCEEQMPSCVKILEIDTDDAWARDTGPTFVVNAQGDVRGIDWEFNAWGGSVDGLYADWTLDNQVAEKVCEALGYDCYEAKPFVLEGGSIHSDGDGTLLVTESCLLSPGRNPDLTKEEITERLKEYLQVQKVIWLPFGIYNDETNEHVDNVCAFVKPGEVILAWTDDPKDPQAAMSQADYDVSSKETDAKGRTFKIHKLPIPADPVCITEYECKGFSFEEGEDTREVGERLAASYVNFYIANKSVVVPQFGDKMDATAIRIIKECFPEREVIGIPARAIIVGGGNIHCITQQIPAKGGKRCEK